MYPKVLRNKIVESLKSQGFSTNGIVEPKKFNKNTFRKIQQTSKNEQINLQKHFLEEGYEVASKYFINGKDLNPADIKLELRLIGGGTEESKIFRWWNLVWWSVPYQKAYGRQMRFLVWDLTHNAPFGLIGLQSPILRMAVRDKHLKIPMDSLDLWVNKSMQAQRLGALPPYNQLLGGKMTALSITSNELRREYKKKYKDITTIMEKRIISPDLLFLTTTSAFGRSSIYNRLKYNNDIVAESLGYTKGSGSFHIPQTLYVDILKYLSENDVNIKTTFGNGPSRKLKLLEKAFTMLDLPKYSYHNIQREFFIFPLAKNLMNVIAKDVQPRYFNRKLSDLTEYWKERWCLPRSKRFDDWKMFSSKKFISNTIRKSINIKF